MFLSVILQCISWSECKLCCLLCDATRAAQGNYSAFCLTALIQRDFVRGYLLVSFPSCVVENNQVLKTPYLPLLINQVLTMRLPRALYCKPDFRGLGNQFLPDVFLPGGAYLSPRLAEIMAHSSRPTALHFSPLQPVFSD